MSTSTKNLGFLAVFLAAASVSAKMHIWVYSGLYLGADRWSMKFSTPQKCYTFSSCFSDNTVGAEWDEIDYQAIVFYEKEQCQGTKLISHTLPKGQLMFPSVKGAKSFMVWSDGMYATKGMELECLERATINGTNSSSHDGSSAEVGDLAPLKV